MKQDTHRKALRAAQSVVAAGHRRAGVLTAAALLGSPGACSWDSGGGATGAGGADDDIPSASQDSVTSGTTDATTTSEDVAVSTADATVAPDVAVTPDVAVAPDVGTTQDVEVAPDVATPPDVPVGVDAAMADSSPSPACPEPVEGTCVFPTDQECDGGWISWSAEGACAKDADCEYEGQFEDFACVDTICKMAACTDSAFFCIEGICHNGQMGSDTELSALAETCCFEAYEAEEFWVPFGCTPWGPPAPPAWDGRTLMEYT